MLSLGVGHKESELNSICANCNKEQEYDILFDHGAAFSCGIWDGLESSSEWNSPPSPFFGTLDSSWTKAFKNAHEVTDPAHLPSQAACL